MQPQVEVQRVNPFAVAKPQSGGAVAVQEGRDAQQIQSALVIAKRYPRDNERAYTSIIDSCKRPRLAEAAIYSYPKGGTQIEGPSIRLAECIATAWGNMRQGWFEIESREGESMICAYAWDLQTNAYKDIVFKVKHSIYTKNGDKKLTDPRDIYEHCANQASRRVRNCILAIIPGDVVEDALDECNKTMKLADDGKTQETMTDKVRKILLAFGDLSVSKDMIEKYLTHKIEACSNAEIVKLRKVYSSIRDGFGKREDYFDLPPPDTKPANVQDPVTEVKNDETPKQETAGAATTATAEKPKEEPPKTQETQAPTTEQKPEEGKKPTTEDPNANMLALEILLEKAGVTDPQQIPKFLDWLKDAKLMSTKLKTLRELANFPRKLAGLVADWDKYRPLVVEYLKSK